MNNDVVAAGQWFKNDDVHNLTYIQKYNQKQATAWAKLPTAKRRAAELRLLAHVRSDCQHIAINLSVFKN